MLSAQELGALRAEAQGGAAQVSSSDVPQLHVQSGSRQDEGIDLSGGNGKWKIGSAADVNLRFEDENVSAEQAVLTVEDGRWKIADQFSMNHTCLNGQLANISYFSSGDSLAFGRVHCVVTFPSQAKKAGPSAVADSTGRTTAVWVVVASAVAVVVAGVLFVAA